MKVTYDPEVDAFYLYLVGIRAGGVDRSEEVAPSCSSATTLRVAP